jgi:demethylmenaquinone methyltransferase/2-methoxy-6-polyprenyl-1,4-benzoquinol methylase
VTGHDHDQIEELLAEQVRYYSARAPEYVQTALDDLDAGDASVAEGQIVAAIKNLALSGDVLELACGPGTWTELLLQTASTVTAVDASPEMLALAATSVGPAAGRVRFVHADLFRWRPDRQYDAVFFGFWLSHVPGERPQARRSRDLRRRRLPL